MNKVFAMVACCLIASLSQAQEAADIGNTQSIDELLRAENAEQIAEYFLKNEEALDDPTASGLTPLQLAISEEREALARQLVALGADPSGRGALGVSAVYFSHLQGWKWLVSQAFEENPGLAAEQYFTALERNQEDYAIAILDIASTDIALDGMPAIHGAILAKSPKVLSKILSPTAGTSVVESRNSGGMTPLQFAIVVRNSEAVEALIGAGADVNVDLAKGRSPLFLLAGTLGPETTDRFLAEKLLIAGAQVRHADLDVSATDLAVSRDAIGMLALLGDYDDTPPSIDSVVAAVLDDDENKITEFASRGFDLSSLSSSDWPLTFIAVDNGSFAALGALLDNGAPIDGILEDGWTIFHIALRSENLKPWEKGSAVNRLLRENLDKAKSLFFVEDKSGRSAATLAPVYLPALGIEAIPDTIFELALSHADSDELTPLLSAILSEAAPFVERATRLGKPIPKVRGISMQDVARGQDAWNIFHRLPDDRSFAAIFKLGFDKAAAKVVQEALKNWGYYESSIDGIFGPGSRAALTAMLIDRMAELENIATTTRHGDMFVRWPKTMPDDTLENRSYARVEKSFLGGNCRWKLHKFNSKPRSKLIGCFKEGDQWNSNGFGLLVWDNGKKELMVFGPLGWDDLQRLK